MNRLSLGTAQFGMSYGIANKSGRIADTELNNILNLAAKHNIDTFDTAIAYGDAEQRFGEHRLNLDYKVISKVGEIPHSCKDIKQWLLSEVTNSLRRLKLNKLDALLLHRPQQLFSTEGKQLYSVLHELKKSGMISKIGISVYHPDELDLLSQNGMQMDIIQIPFNIIDARFAKTGWIQRLYQQGIEIHARSIFLQGLLLMKPSERPSQFNVWQDTWLHWHEFLTKNGITALEACLSYALSFKEINKFIIGIDSSKQLEEILAAVSSTQDLKVPKTLSMTDNKLLNPSNWVTV